MQAKNTLFSFLKNVLNAPGNVLGTPFYVLNRIRGKRI